MWTETLETDVLEVTDTEWVEQVIEQMLALDDALSVGDVDHIAVELAGRPRWRALSPRAAAHKALDEPEAVDGV